MDGDGDLDVLAASGTVNWYENTDGMGTFGPKQLLTFAASVAASVLGDRLRARHPKSQESEALLGCNILNRMFELGRPASYAIGS